MDLLDCETLDDLKELAAVGKLEYNGQRLMPDLFKPVAVSWVFSTQPDGVEVSATINTGKRTFSLDTCTHLGKAKPCWLVKGPVLRIFPRELPYKLLDQAYRRDVISHDAAESLAQRLDDLDIPFEGLEKPVIVESDPLPILRLQERTGALAQLWMRYPDTEHHFVPLAPPDSSKRKMQLEEQWERDLLETDYQRKASDQADYYCPVDKVGKSLQFLLECGWQIEDHQHRQVLLLSERQIELDEQASQVRVRGHLRFDQFDADIAAVMGAFNRREHFVDLTSQQVGLLADEPLAALDGEVEIVGDSVHINKGRFAALADQLGGEGVHMDATLQALRQATTDAQAVVEAGAGFHAELRPYQQAGLDWLGYLERNGLGGVLADDMGLGKTIQVIALISRLSPEQRVLIVVPRSLLFHWQRELSAFLPDCTVAVHHGAQRDREALDSAQVLITSYGTLLKDEALFCAEEFHLLVLDEAQAIKNPDTRTAQAVYRLQGHCRLSLTGTPVENRLEELWSQYRFVLPGLLGDRKVGEDTAARWKQRIQPFLLRRTKSAVALDLPPKTEQVVWVEMEAEQRDTYERFLSQYKGNLLQKVHLDGSKPKRMEVFEAILRLRQICCHPLLASEEGASGKFTQLLEDIESVVEEGSKVLIYSQFTSMLNLIEKQLPPCKWVRLDGSTRDREAVVEQFQSDPDTQVFLISLKAGGTGLNLTAADYVFVYDPWWNEAVERQAIDRAHRIGRSKPVIARRYVMCESVEEKMLKLKAAKQRLADDLLVSDEAALSIDDLLQLLE